MSAASSAFIIQNIVRFFFFFFNDTATTEIYTLSLHDALPIYHCRGEGTRNRSGPGMVAVRPLHHCRAALEGNRRVEDRDRKSTRLNSSHQIISYAVFCLKKKIKNDGIHCYTLDTRYRQETC